MTRAVNAAKIETRRNLALADSSLCLYTAAAIVRMLPLYASGAVNATCVSIAADTDTQMQADSAAAAAHFCSKWLQRGYKGTKGMLRKACFLWYSNQKPLLSGIKHSFETFNTGQTKAAHLVKLTHTREHTKLGPLQF